jgi:predicted deacylase
VKGIFYSKFRAGSQVIRGETIGYITDEFGVILEKIVSPKKGVILYMKGTPPTKYGSTLFCISSYKL